MTVKEDRADICLTQCLEHLGERVREAQGDATHKPTTGLITIAFDMDGVKDVGFVGALDKLVALGALYDVMATFRELANAHIQGEIMDEAAYPFHVPDKKKH